MGKRKKKKRLIDSKRDAEAQEELIAAVMADDPKAVARAVACDWDEDIYGADVEAKMYDRNNGDMGGSKTALYVAARNNKLKALKYLPIKILQRTFLDGLWVACFYHRWPGFSLLFPRIPFARL